MTNRFKCIKIIYIGLPRYGGSIAARLGIRLQKVTQPVQVMVLFSEKSSNPRLKDNISPFL